ncbi:helix-turn-helix transcriptional regulator [Cytobacillus praedii]|uniref:helix-turn-helix domain-containing protein n=1 Tax=Cytobacillus praedii TaxID=1742358 RepID=UPI002E1C4A7A|nr:helix-turn-helix transcriptional regulator [Cytobacillus praedii]
MKFGSILQACRERAGLSQEELAEKLNRTQSCISKFEKDKRIPDMTTFMQWIQTTQTQEVAVAFLYGMDGINLLQQMMPLIGGLIFFV